MSNDTRQPALIVHGFRMGASLGRLSMPEETWTT